MIRGRPDERAAPLRAAGNPDGFTLQTVQPGRGHLAGAPERTRAFPSSFSATGTATAHSHEHEAGDDEEDEAEHDSEPARSETQTSWSASRARVRTSPTEASCVAVDVRPRTNLDETPCSRRSRRSNEECEQRDPNPRARPSALMTPEDGDALRKEA